MHEASSGGASATAPYVKGHSARNFPVGDFAAAALSRLRAPGETGGGSGRLLAFYCLPSFALST
jgi:hypothetical protein